jgi:hypothetical protein
LDERSYLVIAMNSWKRKQLLDENEERLRELRTDVASRSREQLDAEADELIEKVNAGVRAREQRRMYYKTMDGSMTQPQPQMTAQAAWDSWCKAHVGNGLDMLAHEVGAWCGQLEARLNKRISELEAEVGQLRAAAEVERAAKIIDLPNWRKRDAT